MQLPTPMGPGFLIFFNEIRISNATIPQGGGRRHKDKPGPDMSELARQINESRAAILAAIMETDQWL